MTETGLTTALNTSYMAERLALFGVVVGVALLLTGIGLPGRPSASSVTLVSQPPLFGASRSIGLPASSPPSRARKTWYVHAW